MRQQLTVFVVFHHEERTATVVTLLSVDGNFGVVARAGEFHFFGKGTHCIYIAAAVGGYGGYAGGTFHGNCPQLMALGIVFTDEGTSGNVRENGCSEKHVGVERTCNVRVPVA